MSDPFCPRHGRASRPIEIPGLRCDCAPDTETELRREWWFNHGCAPRDDSAYLYGDNGEMQCHACLFDFRRTPIAALRQHVDEKRRQAFDENTTHAEAEYAELLWLRWLRGKRP